jgi:glyceraldehyde-3-phosphate dehydrogenase/erythrose-4-phosphate dehydrogenase
MAKEHFMTTKIGINGFGRIGRDDLQVGAAGDPEEVAADDLTDPRTRSRWTAGGSG